MTSNLKNLLATGSLLVSSLVFATPALAAAPDGNGPWADSVFSSAQGLMKNGLSVPAARSDPNSTLGVAENDTVEPHFFSLGFGGKLALGFQNGISSGVIIVEATNPNYPVEKAKVEVSENGVTWVEAGTVTQDGTVNKPAGVGCVKYVRLTDVSDLATFPDDIADGYDVDGVKASGEPCKPPAKDCKPGDNRDEDRNDHNDNNHQVNNHNTNNNHVSVPALIRRVVFIPKKPIFVRH